MTTARVLNVVPTLMCGGTENQFMALARTLDRTRFDVEFACLRRWGGFVEELEQRNIPLTEYPVPTFRSVTALAQQARLARHIVRRGVQIVHAYNFYGNVFATPPARLVAPVTIASIRDRAPYLTSMQKRVQRYACQFADCILVNADAVKDWLIGDGYDASKISVIRNGVDLSRFDNAPPRSELQRELGLPDGTPLVGVISRLTRLKGLEHFLEAAAMVRARVPNARFLIAGETSPMDREYLGELQQYAERCGVAESVIFTGLRRDVPAVLSSLDVSVMPSLNEALSNVVLESMAAGAPTVATRVGGTPEAIVDGVNGVLVPPADSRALADAIVHLLHDTRLATHLGTAARAHIVDHFSIRRMVRSTEDLYVELLERKQRKRLPSAAC
ncbi:MAG TPA: glycosyltransferase [Vicinamibacterales bacterium]|nr:glycosyltransferase [Vicinamibacterales bacterium]